MFRLSDDHRQGDTAGLNMDNYITLIYINLYPGLYIAF
jgi:hypothetical protein